MDILKYPVDILWISTNIHEYPCIFYEYPRIFYKYSWICYGYWWISINISKCLAIILRTEVCIGTLNNIMFCQYSWLIVLLTIYLFYSLATLINKRDIPIKVEHEMLHYVECRPTKQIAEKQNLVGQILKNKLTTSSISEWIFCWSDLIKFRIVAMFDVPFPLRNQWKKIGCGTHLCILWWIFITIKLATKEKQQTMQRKCD